VVQHLSYEVIQLTKKNPVVIGHKLISMFEKKPLHPVLDLHNFNIYRVSQKERTKLRESVPYVKL